MLGAAENATAHTVGRYVGYLLILAVVLALVKAFRSGRMGEGLRNVAKASARAQAEAASSSSAQGGAVVLNLHVAGIGSAGTDVESIDVAPGSTAEALVRALMAERSTAIIEGGNDLTTEELSSLLGMRPYAAGSRVIVPRELGA